LHHTKPNAYSVLHDNKEKPITWGGKENYALDELI